MPTDPIPPKKTSEHTVKTRFGSRKVVVPYNWNISSIEIWKLSHPDLLKAQQDLASARKKLEQASDPQQRQAAKAGVERAKAALADGRFQRIEDKTEISPDEVYVLKPDTDLPGLVSCQKVRITPTPAELKTLEEDQSQRYFTSYAVQAGDKLAGIADPIAHIGRDKIKQLYKTLHEESGAARKELLAMGAESRTLSLKKLERTDGLRIRRTMPALWDILANLSGSAELHPRRGDPLDSFRYLCSMLHALEGKDLVQQDVPFLHGSKLKGDLDLSKLFEHRWLSIALGHEHPRPQGGYKLHPSQSSLAFPRSREGKRILRCTHDEETLEGLVLDPDDGLDMWFRGDWDVELDTEASLRLSWSKISKQVDAEQKVTRYTRIEGEGADKRQIVVEIGGGDEAQIVETFRYYPGVRRSRGFLSATHTRGASGRNHRIEIALTGGRQRVWERSGPLGEGDSCVEHRPDGSKVEWKSWKHYLYTAADGSTTSMTSEDGKTKLWTWKDAQGGVIASEKLDGSSSVKTVKDQTWTLQAGEDYPPRSASLLCNQVQVATFASHADGALSFDPHRVSYEQKNAAGQPQLYFKGSFARNADKVLELRYTLARGAEARVEKVVPLPDGTDSPKITLELDGTTKERSIKDLIAYPSVFVDHVRRLYRTAAHELPSGDDRFASDLELDEGAWLNGRDPKTVEKRGLDAAPKVHRRYHHVLSGETPGPKVLEAETRVSEKKLVEPLAGFERALVTKLYVDGKVDKVQELTIKELKGDGAQDFTLITPEQRKVEGRGSVRAAIRVYEYTFREKGVQGSASGDPKKTALQSKIESQSSALAQDAEQKAVLQKELEVAKQTRTAVLEQNKPYDEAQKAVAELEAKVEAHKETIRQIAFAKAATISYKTDAGVQQVTVDSVVTSREHGEYFWLLYKLKYNESSFDWDMVELGNGPKKINTDTITKIDYREPDNPYRARIAATYTHIERLEKDLQAKKQAESRLAGLESQSSDQDREARLKVAEERIAALEKQLAALAQQTSTREQEKGGLEQQLAEGVLREIQRFERIETFKHYVPETRNNIVSERIGRMVRVAELVTHVDKHVHSERVTIEEEFDKYITEFCVLSGGGTVYVLPGLRDPIAFDPKGRKPKTDKEEGVFVPSHASYKGVEKRLVQGGAEKTYRYSLSRSIRLGDVLERELEIFDDKGRVVGEMPLNDPFRAVTASLHGDEVIKQHREKWDLDYGGNEWVSGFHPTVELSGLQSVMRLVNHRGDVLGSCTLKHPLQQQGADRSKFRWFQPHAVNLDLFSLEVRTSSSANDGFCYLRAAGLPPVSGYVTKGGEQRTMQLWNPARVRYEISAGKDKIGHGVLAGQEEHDGALYLRHEALGDPSLKSSRYTQTSYPVPGQELAQCIPAASGKELPNLTIKLKLQQDAHRFQPLVMRARLDPSQTAWDQAREKWFKREAALRKEIKAALGQARSSWAEELKKDGLSDAEKKRFTALQHLVEQPLQPIEIYRSNAELLKPRLQELLVKQAEALKAKKEELKQLAGVLEKANNEAFVKQETWLKLRQALVDWQYDKTLKPEKYATLEALEKDVNLARKESEELFEKATDTEVRIADLQAESQAINNGMTDPLHCLPGLLEEGETLKVPRVFETRGVPCAFRTELKVVFRPFAPKQGKRVRALKAKDLPHVLVVSGFLRGVPDTAEGQKLIADTQPGMIGQDPLSRVGWGMRFIRCQEEGSVQFIPDDSKNEAMRGCAIWRGTLTISDNNRHPEEARKYLKLLKLYNDPNKEDAPPAESGLDPQVQKLVASLEPVKPSKQKNVTLQDQGEIIEEFACSGIPMSPYRCHLLETLATVYDRRFVNMPADEDESDKHNTGAKRVVKVRRYYAGGSAVGDGWRYDIVDKYSAFLRRVEYLAWRMREQNVYWSHTWITDKIITDAEERKKKQVYFNWFAGIDTSKPILLQKFWDETFGDCFGSLLARVVKEDAPEKGQSKRPKGSLTLVEMAELPGRLLSSPVHSVLRQKIAGPDGMGLRLLPAEVAEGMGAFSGLEHDDEDAGGLFVNSINAYDEHERMVQAYEAFLEKLEAEDKQGLGIKNDVKRFWDAIKEEFWAASLFHGIKLLMFAARKFKLAGKLSDSFFDPNNVVWMTIFNLIEARSGWRDVGIGAALKSWKAHDVYESKMRAAEQGYGNLRGLGKALITPQWGMEAEDDPATETSNKAWKKWEKLDAASTKQRDKAQRAFDDARRGSREGGKQTRRAARKARMYQSFVQGLERQQKDNPDLKRQQTIAKLKAAEQASTAEHSRENEKWRSAKNRVKKEKRGLDKATRKVKAVRKRKKVYGDWDTQLTTDKEQLQQDKKERKDQKKNRGAQRARKLGRRKLHRHAIHGKGYDYDPTACKHKVFYTLGMEAKLAYEWVWIWWLLKISISPFVRVMGQITVGWEWRTHTRDNDAQDKDDRKFESKWSDVRRMLHRQIYHNEGEFASHIIGLKEHGGETTDFFTHWFAKLKHRKHDTLSQKYGRKLMLINNYLSEEGDELSGPPWDVLKWGKKNFPASWDVIAGNEQKKKLGLDKESIEKRILYRQEEAKKWDDRLKRWVELALKEAYPELDVCDTVALQRERQAELDELIAQLKKDGTSAGVSPKQIDAQIEKLREGFPLERGSMMAVLSAKSHTKMVPCPACDEQGIMQDWAHYDDPSKRVRCVLCSGTREVPEYDQIMYSWCEPRNPLRYLVVNSDFYHAHYKDFTTSQARLGAQHDAKNGPLQRGPHLGRYGYFIQGLWNLACQLGPGVSQVTLQTVRFAMEDNYGNLNDMHPGSLCVSWPVCAGEVRAFIGGDLEVEPIWNILLDKARKNSFFKKAARFANWSELCIKGTLETSVGGEVDALTWSLNTDWRLDCSLALHCLGFVPSLTVYSAKILWADWWLGPRLGLSHKKRQERLEWFSGDTIILNKAYCFTETVKNETQAQPQPKE